MAEYIDKKTAWEAIIALPKGMDERTLQYAIDAVRHIPAADVTSVVHGKWVRVYEDCDLCHKCSLCGKSALLDGCENEVLSDFCSHCGAKMDGVERSDYD